MKRKFVYILVAIFVTIFVTLIILKYFIYRNPLNVNVSKINVETKLERFDRDLLLVSKEDPYKVITELQNKYGYFFELYNREIIRIGSVENSSYLVYLNTFLSDYAVYEAYKEVNRVFKNTDNLEKTMIDGFKHIKYYFPEKKLPRVVTFVAGFNQSIVINEGFIGIGLDKYLGIDCKIYDMLQIPDYLRIEMTPEQIPIDVVRAWVEYEFPYESETNYLIEYMIYNGRTLYFLDACYPNVKEEIKHKYTKKQLDYCYLYEREIWTRMVEQKFIFNTDNLTIKKFIESAPFTSEFGPESTPRIGNWLGYQIVKSYVKNNKIKIEDLMKEKDLMKILNKSGYNPKYR